MRVWLPALWTVLAGCTATVTGRYAMPSQSPEASEPSYRCFESTPPHCCASRQQLPGRCPMRITDDVANASSRFFLAAA